MNVPFGRVVPSTEHVHQDKNESRSHWKKDGNHCQGEKVVTIFGIKFLSCKAVSDEVGAGQQDIEDEEFGEEEDVHCHWRRIVKT